MQNKAQVLQILKHCRSLLELPASAHAPHFHDAASTSTSEPAEASQHQQDVTGLMQQPSSPPAAGAQSNNFCSSPSTHAVATVATATEAPVAANGHGPLSTQHANCSRRLFGGADADLHQQTPQEPEACCPEESLAPMDTNNEDVVDIVSDDSSIDEVDDQDVTPAQNGGQPQFGSKLTQAEAAHPQQSEVMLTMTHFFAAKHGMSWLFCRKAHETDPATSM